LASDIEINVKKYQENFVSAIDMKMLGPLSYLLGIEFVKKLDGLLLVQELYAEKLEEKFRLHLKTK
jgi:hypothetical protein